MEMRENGCMSRNAIRPYQYSGAFAYATYPVIHGSADVVKLTHFNLTLQPSLKN